MKKLFVLTMMLLAVHVAVIAQREAGDLTVQPKVGMNLSSLSDADKSIVDLCLGLEGEYMLTDDFSLAAGVVFSNQGAKYDDKSITYTADLDYVNVPVMANYYVLPGLALKVGVQPGIKMKAKAKMDGGTVDLDILYQEFSSLTGEKYKVNSVDLSIPIGVSYEYKNIVLDARYNWGLTKIMNVGDSFYNRVFQFTLGYKLPLGN